MNSISVIQRIRTYLFRVALSSAFLLTLAVSVAPEANAVAAGTGPCDIYASGGTPCVAAHSTVRALYGSYNGSLYQVRRSSDNSTLNIGVVSAGGVANAAAQDNFCSGTSCVITVIYDQSGHGNNLTQAPGGGAAGGPDNLANASALPVTLGGSAAYGVRIDAGMGYRNDNTSGIATGDSAEGEYAVFDGTHYNNGCCFDYGNAETNNNDNGAGHMEAIYFGNITAWGRGSGSGPWIMADMENGLFSGQSAGLNSGDPSISYTFVTAIIKGQSNQWAIRGGNAQSGGLSTYFSGGRPSGYNPMHKEGAIILGIGGDNSKSSAGSFYEGAMTSGYPSDSTENSVQSNIVAAGYGGSGAGGGGSNCGGSGGSGTYYTIVNRNSGKVLDVQNTPVNNNCDGANVGQYDSNGGAWQNWRLASSVSGYYTIISQNSGKCLDVQMPNTSSGANVGIWTCNGNAWQDWQLVSQGSGYYTIVSRNSGLCLDVQGASTANLANVQQYTCNGGYNQEWQLPGYGGGGGGGGGTTYVHIQNRASGLMIDGMGRTSNGSNAGQWSSSSSYNQQWQVISAGSYVKLQNRATGLYLDGMGRTSNGSAAGQWSSSSSYNQQWSETSSGGYTRFQNRATGLYLDGMGRTSNGSDLGQWSSSGSYNQQWTVQ